MKRRLRKMLVALIICLAILSLGIGLYLQQPKFGALPEGARLERINSSPNYVDGQFQNLVYTPKFTEESSSTSALWKYLFIKKKRLAPTDSIPTIKTDLMSLDKDEDVVIWLGHSSYIDKAIRMGNTIWLYRDFLPIYRTLASARVHCFKVQ